MNIFNEIKEEERQSLLKCLRAVTKSYLKEEEIFDESKELNAIGYVVSGHVRLVKDDYNGNKLIISEIMQEETFGEAIVCGGFSKSKISAIAVEDTQVLYLDITQVISVCQNACPFHKKLIENLLKIISIKNIQLQDRLELLSKRNLRERILYFLHHEKEKQIQKIFTIPYSREQMAEYLGVDRSSLSRELSNMKLLHILDYHKNMFKLN